MRRNGALPIRGARVAHVIETDGPGGAERMLAQLAGELQAAGCPGVAFLPAGQEGWLSRELAAAGIAVEKVGTATVTFEELEQRLAQSAPRTPAP